MTADPLPARPDGADAADEAPRRLHPLFHAGAWILNDLASTLAFVVLFEWTHSVVLATALSIGLGLAQILIQVLRRAPVDAMQWMSLGLVVVFGGATLITHDPRFVMLKPTLIYLAVAAVMIRPGWMNRYMPPVVLRVSADLTTGFGYAWAGLMALTAVANLAVALTVDTADWAMFIGVFPIASKVVLVLIQYLVVRQVTRGRILRAAVSP